MNFRKLKLFFVIFSLTIFTYACSTSKNESPLPYGSTTTAFLRSDLQTTKVLLTETEKIIEKTETTPTTNRELETTETEEIIQKKDQPELIETVTETKKMSRSFYDYTENNYEVPPEMGSDAITTPDEWEMEEPVKAYVDSRYGLGLRLRCSPGEKYDYVSKPIAYGTPIDVYSLYRITGSDIDKEHVFVYYWLYCCYDGVWGWCKDLEVTPEACFENIIPENVVFPASYTIYDYYDSNISEEDGNYYTKIGNIEVKSSSSETAQTLYSLSPEQKIKILGTDGTTSSWRFISYYGENNKESCGWIRIVNDSDETLLMATKEYYNLHPEVLEREMLTVDKPAIYLYPEKETQINLKLDIINGKLLTTYPKYQDGWTVTAFPDGKIINQDDGYNYDYLFWDAVDYTTYDMSHGFCVKGEYTENFLREKLTLLGLNEKEMNEFIVYWLPKMEFHPYNFICFHSEEYAQNCKLRIQPSPDSVLRLLMITQPLEHSIAIKPQTLIAFERKGFTVVEWGGRQIHQNE